MTFRIVDGAEVSYFVVSLAMLSSGPKSLADERTISRNEEISANVTAKDSPNAVADSACQCRQCVGRHKNG